MPVSPAGQIAIPYAGLFHIEGMTSIEAAQAIARLFVQEQILRDPRVIVTTQQFGYSVTVMGEVRISGHLHFGGQEAAGRYAHRGGRRERPGGTCHRDLPLRLDEKSADGFMGPNTARK